GYGATQCRGRDHCQARRPGADHDHGGPGAHHLEELDREEGAVLGQPGHARRHLPLHGGPKRRVRRRATRTVKRVANQLFACILVNSVYEMKNYPVVLVNTVLSPLSFLILIFFVSDGKLLGDAIEGGLIMTMFSSGTSLQSDLSHYKNDFKLQDIVVGSPTSAAVYV